jgi:hypothetical protein
LRRSPRIIVPAKVYYRQPVPEPGLVFRPEIKHVREFIAVLTRTRIDGRRDCRWVSLSVASDEQDRTNEFHRANHPSRPVGSCRTIHASCIIIMNDVWFLVH